MNARRWRPAVAVSAVLAVFALSGCAPQADLDAEAAGILQQNVLEVTQAVADGDFAGAMTELDELAAALDKAASDGSVSFARHQDIEQALETVRADVQAALDAAEPPPVEEPLPEDQATDSGTEGNVDDGNGNDGNGNDGNDGNQGDGNGNEGNQGDGNGDNGNGGGNEGNGNSPPPSSEPEPTPETTSTPS
ncbi:hypothetical protein [Okibacterium endophyticum]